MKQRHSGTQPVNTTAATVK